MKELDDALRHNAADEASTATLLRDEAAKQEREGNHKRASAYHNAAAKADNRAGLWRRLLKKS